MGIALYHLLINIYAERRKPSPVKKEPAGKRRLSIKNLFRNAALGVAAVTVAPLYGAFLAAFYPGRGQKLTPGEKQFVESIFGDRIKADKIRKHFKKPSHPTHLLRGKRGTVLPPTSHIDFFGAPVWSKDYSREDIKLFGFFIHEVTHVWQNQNRAWKLHDLRNYEYTLKEDSKFTDFGPEQQAEIIEAYAMRWLHRDGQTLAKPETATHDARLIDVVETQFPRARETRLQLDAARNKTPQNTPSAAQQKPPAR